MIHKKEKEGITTLKMKKLITVDDIICSFLSAVAYGFGYSIPAFFKAPGWLCLIICTALGLLTEEISAKLIYNKYVQEKSSRRFLVSLLFILFFVICDIVSKNLLGESLVGNLEEEIITTVIFALIGFVISLLIKCYKRIKIIKRYGKGNNGYKFSDEEIEYIRSLDNINKEIIGKYDQSLAVKTRTGIYVGVKEEGVICFNGIPYAKAPIKKLRWKAPVRLDDSDKVYEAKYFGSSSIQVNYKGNPLSFHRQSEDCLYLNVCTKKISSEDKKPVVVYLHGGDFTYGGSASSMWNTSNFVKTNENIVSVTFNYRLGLLGFIDLTNVPGSEDYKDSINLGLLDQIAALEWIKENIDKFGGDNNNITLIGDSSGGISISLLGVCLKANNLFNKAIILSGNPFYLSNINGNEESLTRKLLKGSNASNMEDLLSLSEKEISNLSQKLKKYMLNPKCDGRILPLDFSEAYKKGIGKHIEFIICMSRDNLNCYASSIGRSYSMNLIEETIDGLFKVIDKETVTKLKKLLNENIQKYKEEKGKNYFYNYLLDNVGQYKLAKTINNGESLTYLLYWDVDPVVENLGVGVTQVVSTVLNNKETANTYGNIVDDNIQEVLNKFIIKAINDKSLALYKNEVVGIDSIEWETFPYMLIFKTNIISLERYDEELDIIK